jgi:hypothetical protein
MGTPPLKIVSPENEVDVICSKMQSRYRSGIGMLLLRIKYSRTYICIVVKDMSNINGATGAARYLQETLLNLGRFNSSDFQTHHYMVAAEQLR